MAQVMSLKDRAQIEAWTPPQMSRSGERQNGAQTLDNRPRVRSPAEEAGFQAGYAEGLKLAKQQAYDDARLEMATQFCAEWEHKLEQLQNVIKTLEKPVSNIKQELEVALLNLVESLVTKLTRASLKYNKSQTLALINEAIALLGAKKNGVQIQLSTEDRTFFMEHFPQEMADLAAHLVDRSEMKPGDFKVIAEDSLIDATLTTRLDSLIAQVTDQQQLITSQAMIEEM